MKKFYACEQHALTKYLENRKQAEIRRVDPSAGFYEDLVKKTAEMNNILTVDIINKTATVSIFGILVDRDPDVMDAYFNEQVVSYKAIRKAASDIINQGITKAEFLFDTPGGQVSGVEKTRNELQALSGLIEVKAVNVGMCCSAGMWLASGIGKLEASDRTSEAGSIGVVVVGYDDSLFLSNFGVERHVITNTQSSEKIPDITQESGREIIRDQLDAFYGVFKDNVSNGMGLDGDKVDALKGRVLIGNDAIEYGLMISGYARDKDDKDKNSQSNSPAQAVENNTEGAPIKMAKLDELLLANPEAKAEYDAALKSAEEKGKLEANENTAQILALEGVKLSASATEALDNGIDPKTYAFNKLKAEQEKRATVETKKPIFASLATPQTPGEQAKEKTPEQIKAEDDAYIASMEKAAERTFGGKK